jgi:hypothetical protein
MRGAASSKHKKQCLKIPSVLAANKNTLDWPKTTVP